MKELRKGNGKGARGKRGGAGAEEGEERSDTNKMDLPQAIRVHSLQSNSFFHKGKKRDR